MSIAIDSVRYVHRNICRFLISENVYHVYYELKRSIPSLGMLNVDRIDRIDNGWVGDGYERLVSLFDMTV